MCGIVGIKQKDARQSVATMLETLRHRGPDDHGTAFVSEWSLGHVRLSVIDLKNGQQPMSGQSEETVIVYNGEIYNFKKLRAALGGEYDTLSDTEVLLKFYESEEPPESWLKKLDGMYALAIVGPKGLLLARDPLGVKPLYVGMAGKALVFASELKAVLTQTDRLLDFPPGHFYTTKRGVQPFYEIQQPETTKIGFEQAARQLKTLVRDCVKSRMISDVPVGVFLSGGLDSSIIAAIAVRENPNIKSFSVGLKDSPDLLAARDVAAFLKTDHYERIITPKEAVDATPKVIRLLESFDSSLVRSAVANYFLAELASKHVKVALSGEGADELFAGYSYLRDFPQKELDDELFSITTSLHNTNLQRCDRMSMAHGLEVRVPFLDKVSLVEFALALPSQFKINHKRGLDKWILREAFANMLPHETIWRKKAKFAEGAGLGDVLGNWATNQIRVTRPQKLRALNLRNAEEAFYYKTFRRAIPERNALHLVGRSRSL